MGRSKIGLGWIVFALLVGFPGVHMATGGEYAKLLDGDWYQEEILRMPAKRGHPRFERRVEKRMKDFGEDRATAEKNVEEFYRRMKANPD